MGDNTDGAGLVNDLTRNLGLELADTRILLLGAGGAARGVLGPLLAAGPARLEIVNRDGDRARASRKSSLPLGEIRGAASMRSRPNGRFDLVINATAASLQDTIPPVPPSAIGPTTLCYDMAYGKGDTAFTRWAQGKPARGAPRPVGECSSNRPRSPSCCGAACEPETAHVLKASSRLTVDRDS